jgi:polar amino acid transport system substrate-binding protein
MRYRITLLALLCVATAAALFAVQDRSLTHLRQAGVIRIGYDIEAPYAFVLSDGSVTGAFPKLAVHIATELGIQRVEWVQADFDTLIPNLEAGRFDVIAAGMFITPRRAERVAFSEPVLRAQQGLLVRAGNPHNLHAYSQAAKQPNVRIAVLAGSIEETLLRHVHVPEAQIVVVPDVLTGQAALLSGIADGLALTTPTLRSMALRDQWGNLALAEPFEQPDPALMRGIGYCGFAFRASDGQLRAAWNAKQQSFMATPSYVALLMSFGFTQAELPGKITTTEVLRQ